MRILLALFLLVSCFASAHEAKPGCDLFLQPGLVDPYTFLSLDEQSADYTVYVDRDHDTKSGYVFIELSHDGERIGRMVTTTAHASDQLLMSAGFSRHLAIIDNVILHPDYQGKKLGLLMYLTMARELFKKGHLLMKSFDTSAAADAMWDDLADRGLALKLRQDLYSNYVYVFNPQVLANKAAWAKLELFIKRHEEVD